MTADLRTDNLTLGYGQSIVVEDMSLRLPTGQVTALIGANGSGKSTILKALARLLKPRAGAVLLDGKAIHAQRTKQVARHIAILPQGHDAPAGLTVRELVAFGRYPYQSSLGRFSRDDDRLIDGSIDTTGLAGLSDRPLATLSGGQRQRAWIAMALAQNTAILLLDEPTTFLDMSHQLEVLELLNRLNREQQRTIVMVLHDLNHASRYAHHLVGIREGEVFVQGPPREVVTTDVLHQVFGIDAHIVNCPRYGVPLCIPYALGHGASNEQNSDYCAVCERKHDPDKPCGVSR